MSSSSRAQSQSSRYGRKRSNTTQSAYKPNNTSATSVSLVTTPSIKVGESKTLAAWVHDHEKSAAVIFNHNWWPGINEGDLLRATLGDPDSGFLFFVPREDLNPVKPQLQVRVFLAPEDSSAHGSATISHPFPRYLSPAILLRCSASGTTEISPSRRCGPRRLRSFSVCNSTPNISFPARQRLVQSGLCRVCIPGSIPRPK